MHFFFRALFVFLRIMDTALFLYVILSWIAPRTQVHSLLARFVEPFLGPFRALAHRLLGKYALPIDFSVIFAFIGIEVLNYFLTRLNFALL